MYTERGSDMIKLYENIREFRKQNKWTQEELAQRMGYTDRSTIAKIEAGKVDLSQSKIIEFANVFGVDPGELMGWDGEEPDSEGYYLDPESAELAEFAHKNPEYKALFDASRKVKPEDINFVLEMIKRTSNYDD